MRAFAALLDTEVDVDVRGNSVQRLVHLRDVLWCSVNKHDLLRLVIVRDPAGSNPWSRPGPGASPGGA